MPNKIKELHLASFNIAEAFEPAYFKGITESLRASCASVVLLIILIRTPHKPQQRLLLLKQYLLQRYNQHLSRSAWAILKNIIKRLCSRYRIFSKIYTTSEYLGKLKKNFWNLVILGVEIAVVLWYKLGEWLAPRIEAVKLNFESFLSKPLLERPVVAFFYWTCYLKFYDLTGHSIKTNEYTIKIYLISSKNNGNPANIIKFLIFQKKSAFFLLVF